MPDWQEVLHGLFYYVVIFNEMSLLLSKELMHK
jgi:hypothetical protein